MNLCIICSPVFHLFAHSPLISTEDIKLFQGCSFWTTKAHRSLCIIFSSDKSNSWKWILSNVVFTVRCTYSALISVMKNNKIRSGNFKLDVDQCRCKDILYVAHACDCFLRTIRDLLFRMSQVLLH